MNGSQRSLRQSFPEERPAAQHMISLTVIQADHSLHLRRAVLLQHPDAGATDGKSCALSGMGGAAVDGITTVKQADLELVGELGEVVDGAVIQSIPVQLPMQVQVA